jgi:hypothetical protein
MPLAADVAGELIQALSFAFGMFSGRSPGR